MNHAKIKDIARRCQARANAAVSERVNSSSELLDEAADAILTLLGEKKPETYSADRAAAAAQLWAKLQMWEGEDADAVLVIEEALRQSECAKAA